MRYAPGRGRKIAARRTRVANRLFSSLLLEHLEERRLLAVDAVNDTVRTTANQVAAYVVNSHQPFATNVAAGAAFAAAYPEFTGATAVTSVVNGALVIAANSASSLVTWNGALPNSDIYTVSVDLGRNTDTGNYNMGLRIGENNIIFHPGYPNGAFRVEGPGGFGNTSMTWTTEPNVINNMRVTVNKLTGVFTIAVTSGRDETLASFTTTFTNINSVNGPISLFHSGSTAGNAVFDNFIIGTPRLIGNDIDAVSVQPATLTSASGATVILNADGTFSYDPRGVAAFRALSAGVTANDSFTYTAVGSDSSTDTATVNVVVYGNNMLPVAGGDSYAATDSTPLVVAAGAANRLIVNDSDPDASDTISVLAGTVTSALGATVTIAADGSFTYNTATSVPLQSLKPGVARADTFTYSLRDSANATVTGTATVTVTGTNTPPVAPNSTGPTTNEDTLVTTGTIYNQPFDTPAADAAAFALAYPGLVYSNQPGGSFAVANGRIEIAGSDNIDRTVTVDKPTGNYTVSLDINTDGSPGSFNVGVQIGSHRIGFHPGYGGAALYITGTGGFGNTNIGWTPAMWTAANNVMHKLRVFVNVTTGELFMTLTDGENANNVFAARVASTPAAVSGPLMLVRSGPTASKAFFDNLEVRSSTALDFGRDPEGMPTTVTQINSSGSLTGTSAKGATVTMTAQGVYTYDPRTSPTLQQLAVGQSTTDTFTYTVSDGVGGTTTATMTMTITGVNDAPVANNDTLGTNEDTPITSGFSISENFDTPAANTAAFAAAYPQLGTSVNGGVITAANGRVEITGNSANVQQLVIAGAHPGETTVSFDVGTDGSPGSFNVGLQVGNKNIVFHPGYTAIPGAFRVENSSDASNKNMGFVPAVNTMHRMKVHISTAGRVTVTIVDGDNAANVYTYGFDDPSALGAQISLMRQGGAGTSKAFFDNLRVRWGGALANDTDVDLGALTSVTHLNGSTTLTGTSALGAAVTINAQGVWSYNPTGSAQLQALPAGATITDNFTYTIVDDKGLASTATITVPVTGVNDAPIAANDSYSTSEDAPLSVSAAAANRLFANDTDRDTGDTLVVSASSAVSAKGAAVLVNADGSFTYNPTGSAILQSLAAGTSTTDTFTYTIRDSQGATSTATVTVTVSGLNDGPVANNDSSATNENTPITSGFSLFETFNTPAANTAAFIAAYPALGTSVSGGVISVANGRIEITGDNTNAQQLVIAGGHPGETTVSFDVSADSAPGGFNVGLKVGNKNIVFHPGFTGIPGAFRVEGMAGLDGNTDMGFVPALNVLHHMKVQISTAGLVTITIIDGNNPNNVFTRSYTDAGAVGAQLSLMRQGPAGTAKALFDNLRVHWGGALANDTDVDAGALLRVTHLNGATTLTGTSALGAAVSINAEGVWSYNPTGSAQLQALPAGATITDTFTYTIADGAGGTSTATIGILVTGVNDAPVAVNDSYATSEDAVLNIAAGAANAPLANDIDIDTGDTLSVSAYGATSTLGASITMQADGSFTYNPTVSATLQALQVGQSTVDTFTYTVRDSQGATSTATISVTVSGLNDAPTFTLTTSNLTVDENTLLSVPNLAELLDADANEVLTYTIVWGDGSSNSTGTATIVTSGAGQPTVANVSGSHTYTDNGTYSGLLTVQDSQGATITMPFVVTVENAPPTAFIDLAPEQGVPGMPLEFAFSATDPSPDDMAAGFTYLVDWGDDSDPESLSDPASTFHAYTNNGTFTVTVIAYDKDGGASEPVTTEVAISTTAVIDNVLYVGGTSGGDRIVIAGGISVRIGNIVKANKVSATKIVVFGNDGNDTISVTGTTPPVEIYGGEGDDYLAGGAYNDTLDGGAGKDRLIGGSGHDLLLGGAGSDTLAGGAGNDILRGNDGIDLVGGTELPDGSFSLPGDIIPMGGDGGDTLNGDAGNDLLIGSDNKDVLNGGTGNDIVRGLGGNDTLDGGAGDDLLLGDDGDDKLYGRAGCDALLGGAGRDLLMGSTGSDVLYGDLLDDTAPDFLDSLELWFATFLSTPQSAFNDLIDLASDDGDMDTINGETDGDWYLLFTGVDKLSLASESKSPNVVHWL